MLGRFALVSISATASAFLIALAACSSDEGPAPFPGGSSTSSSGGGGSSSSSGGNQTTSGGTTLDGTPCHKYAEALCAFTTRCLPGFADPTGCLPDGESACLRNAKYPGAENAFYTDDCLNSLIGVQCADIKAGGQSAVNSDCVPKGTRPTGQACAIDQQCQTGNCFEAIGSSSNCGTCADFVAENGSCNAGNCVPGTICVGATGSQTCQRPAALGAPCKGAGACQGTNRCVSGSCVAALADGATCTAAGANDDEPCLHECTSGQCASSATGVLVGTGQPCGTGLSGNACSAENSCFNGVCVADVYAGAHCDETAGPKCGDVFDCTGGTCVERALDVCN